MSGPLNAITIDVEDWFHPELVRAHVPPSGRVPRLRAALEPLVELLHQRNTRATFFLLGDLVREYPDVVRQLHEGGHEIACHGMTHRPLWELNTNDFRTELQVFRETVRDIDPSIAIRGYRAPTFSVDSRTSWALQVLSEEGFTYDSSIFPFKNHVYGVAGAPLGIYRPDPQDVTQLSRTGPLQEFPMSVATFGPARLPVCGGFYLRVLPYPLVAWALRRINRHRPFVIYCHPWECDPGTPRLGLGFVDGFITYVGMRGMLGKLGRILDEFPCTRLDEVLAHHG